MMMMMMMVRTMMIMRIRNIGRSMAMLTMIVNDHCHGHES